MNRSELNKFYEKVKALFLHIYSKQCDSLLDNIFIAL